MNLSAPFIRRPIATVLLTAGLALAGAAAFFVLPVAPLPNVDYPAISVSANLAGASPATMASSVATPLERRLAVISGVNEITSSSSTGSTRVSLQFDLSKNIDEAAREVQAAINAARVDLPATLRSNPTYRKRNAAEQPVVILALTSQTRTPGQIYDAASNIIQQRLSQVNGVGEVEIGGSSLPAVRIELAPYALNAYGLSGEDVRAAVQAASANRPKGAVDDGARRLQVYTNRGGHTAADYQDLVIAWRNGAPVRLRDVAEVSDSVQDLRTLGLFNGQPAIVVLVTQQPGANIIQTVNNVLSVLPQLQSELPGDIRIQVASDATVSIRASLHEIEITLMIAIVLVVLVVSAFLRSARATVIPAVATIVSLLGALGAMYLLGFSLNNLSLMALTVATGFVVDDAIVVLENTSRHLEAGMGRFEAALRGAREVGFTVVSMSVSLVAVFIPLLFMGGQVGRLFREFAVTLSAAVLISLVISLTTTPMMCAWLLRREAHGRPRNRFARWAEAAWNRVLVTYEGSLDWALANKLLILLILAAVIGLNVYLYTAVPKGFFPQQDSRRLNGGLRADQSISSRAMGEKLRQMQRIIGRDPAVATVVGFTGGGRAGGGFLAVQLKPPSERRGVKGQDVIQRLRPQLSRVTGVAVFLNPQQDVRMGGRGGNALYQYTLKADNNSDLRTWTIRLSEALKSEPALTDIDNDVQDNGIEAFVDVNRDTAARLGITARDVDNALYDSFGQRQIATIYEDVNQYSVVEENAQAYGQSAQSIAGVYVAARGAAPSATAAPAGPARIAPVYPAVSAASPLRSSLGAISGSLGGVGLAPASGGGGGGAAPAPLRASGGGGGISSQPARTPYEGPSSNLAATPAAGGGGQASPDIQVAGGTSRAGGASAGGQSGASGAPSGAATAANAPRANPGLRDSATGAGISTAPNRMVPLPALASFAERASPASVNHQDAELAATISFNLAPGKSLSDAQAAFQDAEARIAMPTNVRGGFQGTARSFQEQLKQEPMLVLAALVAIYIVLGVLYESLIHPITVLSTLPSAGVGAVLALLIFKMEFSIIALIGVFLLIGIVKKNAILIIDFALDAERSRGLTPEAAVREACLLRFRPILMTTLAAGLGALPLAIGFGEGSELRQPLGVAIIGGLIASQLLTLLTTPVVYIYLDRLRRKRRDERFLSRAGGAAPLPAQG
ncbi:MAG TPA: efflux RND transporter permease subunit [Phenylobacterium sp.]|uniref:efflux RND transporter permease subunit n=1 Tax=Phenylobacterium sp. TaxID=1871053 RepID=UPI002CBA963E|nr:efflux RND transporter permease subunit [Phenylobacterium sp.]HSV02481.1 efflux RND transporter permease subunit [Phenylobacterium sp.]